MSDLAELYARDPLRLTDQDIDSLIKDMREKRAAFRSAAATPAKAPKLTVKENEVSQLGLPELKL